MTLLIFALLTVPVSAILNGWVLSIMWGWFIVPVFGAPILSVAYAIGFGIIVSYLTYRKTNDKSEGFFEAVIGTVVTPLIFLAMGWVVHLFT